MRGKHNVQYVLAGILLGACFAAGVWDISMYLYHRGDDTVSNIIGSWASEYPAFTFALGALFGHLLWPRQPWQQ